MILTLLINLAYAVVSLIIGFLPESTGFPPAAHTATSALGGYLGIVDPLVPVSTLLTCLTLIFSVEIAVFAFKTVKWVISHIPFIGGKGH